MPIKRPATVRHRTCLFTEASEIMHAEYRSDLRVHDVAHRIATSPRALQRAFDEIGGTTFREHLCVVRMAAAAELLRRTHLTVGEVSRRVGYSQQAQFAKAFRRHLGVSPMEYRLARGAAEPAFALTA